MPSKQWASNWMDPALEYIRTNANQLFLCSAEPTTYSGVAALALGYANITSANFDAVANGAESGRALKLNSVSDISISVAGTITFIALVSNALQKLLYVFSATPTVVTIGTTLDTNVYSIEIRDPY